MSKRILHEAGTLAKPIEGSDTYPVRIITEGRGSSGSYSRELLEASTGAFEGALSFMNHPLDPEKPYLRPAENIAGRLVGPVVGKEVDGVYGLYSEFKPNKSNPNRAAFIAEYADVLGLSIYIAGEGHDEGDDYIIESFDGSDPYRSVDIVVAAGRGGRFERAMESYRAIETSAGLPADHGSATAVADEQRKRQHMDEALKALIESLFAKQDEKFVALEAKVDSLVTLSESATAVETAKVEALEVADKLAEAKLTESGRKRVLESVKSGAKIEDAIKTESDLRDEILAEAKNDSRASGYVTEGANSNDDFSVAGLVVE